MIGQKTLIEAITNFFENNAFPRFSIIIGSRGSGRKTLINEIICPQLNDYEKYVLADIKIDNVREMIDFAYKSRKMIFIIPDADNMSAGAKNAMLKIVEECPNDNYFIMTLEDENATLQTIKSRAVVLRMSLYTTAELKYYDACHDDIEQNYDIPYLDICETPGDINLLSNMQPDEFYDYVIKVMSNIATVSGSNSFKIAEKIALKNDDTEKYDLKLFWRAFMKQCTDKALELLDKKEDEEAIRYMAGARDTSRALRRLLTRSVNKQMLFDKWILDIREDWR